MALVAAYAFDEGTGTTAAEASGGTTLTGVPAWDASGRHGASLRLNGVAGPTVDPFASSTAFTIMFDVYIVGAGGNNYNLFLNDTANAIGTVQQGGGSSVEWYPFIGPTGTTIATATWTHVAVVADGTNRRILVNGTQVGTTANTSLSGTDGFILGGVSGYQPNIEIDNLRIYDTALTNAAITALAGTAVTSSGTAYDKTPADAEGITDARSAVQQVARTREDALGLTDSVAVALTLARSPADTLGITDTDDPLVLGYGETIPDPVVLSDNVTAVMSRVHTVADFLAVTDAASPVEEAGGAATPDDPVGVVDAASSAVARARGLADVAAVGDAVVAVMERVATVADTVTAADTAIHFAGLILSGRILGNRVSAPTARGTLRAPTAQGRLR